MSISSQTATPSYDISSSSKKRKLSECHASSNSFEPQATTVVSRTFESHAQSFQGIKDREISIKNERQDNSLDNNKRRKTSTSTQHCFRFIYDQYTEARGTPKMLEITCRKCNAWVMDYQKDGPGKLLRCYVDRIYHPSALRKKIFTHQSVHEITPLVCKKCQTILATPFMYSRRFPKPESRPAYLILTDTLPGTNYKISSIIMKDRNK